MKLNPQQQAAVDHPVDQSLLVMAGAGSGKTTVIANRVMRLLKAYSGSDKSVLMVTFSNKAAKEMKERVKRLGGNEGVMFHTFHSFGLSLMRDRPDVYGLSDDFSILNETDMTRSIRHIARQKGLPATKDMEPDDRKRLNPVKWLGTWSLARQAGYNVENEDNREALFDRLKSAHGLSGEETQLAYSSLLFYESVKRNTSSVDFDDLLYMPLFQLAKNDEYRKSVQVTIGSIVCDETQDSNRIQTELIRYLAQGHCAVTCVGDDDQSIYGWRGAEVTNLKRFVSYFKADQLRLEQNYRSTQSIVNSASSLIENNQTRLPKTPFSMGDVGTTPCLEQYDDSYAMSDALAVRLSRALEAGERPDSFAVLYRTNRMALLLEQSLRRFNVPYEVVGGMSLFDRAEVTAVTSALRLASNPRDTYALKNMTPFIDGFGYASCYALCEWIEENDDATLYGLPEQMVGVPAKAMEAIKSLMSELSIEALTCDDPMEFVEWVSYGMLRVVDREKDDELKSRKEDHLVMMAKDISAEVAERVGDGERVNWRTVMLEVALRDVRQTESDLGSVTLSTVHRSKGLEWDKVIVAGASNGLMPMDSRNGDDEEAGFVHYEEERRIAYVALTRARYECVFLHADKYSFMGSEDSDKVYEPSSFLAEMGVTVSNTFSADDKFGTSQSFDINKVKSILRAGM